jgi:transposase
LNRLPKNVGRWVERFRVEGVDGLKDRSSRPLLSPSQTVPAASAAVEALRRQRYTAKQIAAEVGVSPATVRSILRRLGLNRISALEPAEPIRRYERQHPGELIHLDIKKLGRIDSVGHRITGRSAGVVNRHTASARSSSTSASTTPQASPSSKSCPTKQAKRRRFPRGRCRLFRQARRPLSDG